MPRKVCQSASQCERLHRSMRERGGGCEGAARDLSAALGREVSPEILLTAGVEAIAAVCKAVAAETRAKKG